MCERYYSRSEKQDIAKRMKAKKVFAEPLMPNYNIAPSTLQPIVRQERDEDEREMVLARWGLVPFFASSLAQFRGFSTINAKTETLTSSPTWRGTLKSRRCLVPADGFYEWKALDNSRKPKKQPYAISITNGEPLAFAGLWDAWREPKLKETSIHAPDTWLQSYAIITCEANEIMSTVHTRMPVILRQRDWAEWLDRDAEKGVPFHLLRPFDSLLMNLEPCNPAVGYVKNNGAEMLMCPTGTPADNSI